MRSEKRHLYILHIKHLLKKQITEQIILKKMYTIEKKEISENKELNNRNTKT